MAKSKIVRRKQTLPLYIDKVDNIPELDGYTWKELAQGYYGDYRQLPCPQCGLDQWHRNEDDTEQCVFDGEPFPTIERALAGINRRGLIGLIKKLATRR